MEARTKTRMEYEEQHFGFSSELFIESLRELMKSLWDEAINGAVKLLTKKLVTSAVQPKQVEEALEEFKNSLTVEYGHGIEWAFSSLDNKIKECLSIPDYAVLDSDHLVKKVENVVETDVDRDIEALLEELKNMKFLEYAMKEELTTALGVIANLERADRIDSESVPNLEYEVEP